MTVCGSGRQPKIAHSEESRMTAEARRKIFCKHAELVYSDSTAKKLFTLPKGAYIEDITVHTSTVSTNATVSIGTSGTSTQFVNAQAVATAGLNRVTTVGTYAVFSARTEIYGLIGGSPSSGGPFRVAVRYSTELAKGLI